MQNQISDRLSIDQKLKDVIREIPYVVSGAVDVAIKVPYYFLRGTFLATRNYKDLSRRIGTETRAKEFLIEFITNANCVAGNIVFACASYYYGGVNGLVAYTAATMFSNLSALNEKDPMDLIQ